MSDIAISVENLSKAYFLPQKRERRGLKARLSRHVREYFGALAGTDESDYFWALRNVSFEVKQGDALGFIGKNGSGKSTLLKILSGITDPTEGKAVLKGRVGSLLEVGTGFHPDLTGRQNIFMSGTLLGLSRNDIRKKLDEIIDFANIGQFIDVPVKRYSSGMFVRLAYAVASHLDTDILILDEVLAVGDAEFTERSKRNIEDIVHGGRTILFVSHSMASISDVCQHGVVLSSGKSVYQGNATDAVTFYMQMVHGLNQDDHDFVSDDAFVDLREVLGWDGVRDVVITSVETLKADGTPARVFNTGEGMCIRIGFEVRRETRPYFTVLFMAPTGERAMTVYSDHCSDGLMLEGKGFVDCTIPSLPLTSGDFSLTLDFGRKGENYHSIDCVPNATNVRVRLGRFLGGHGLIQNQGWIAQQTHWSVAQDVQRPEMAGS